MPSLKKIAKNALSRYRVARDRAENGKEIKKTLKLNPQPELTKAQKDEINAFWGDYGIKFRDFRWFQFYYGVTGIKNPAFITPDIYLDIFKPHYNKDEYVKAWRDKAYFPVFLPSTPFPETYIKKCNGRLYDKNGALYTGNDLDGFLRANIPCDEFIVKITQSCQGQGVFKVRFDDTESYENARKTVEKNTDLVIQKVIKQHPFFSSFNSSSVNIIRFYTLFDGKDVAVFDCATLRFGIEGCITDVGRVDGVEVLRSVMIDKNGNVKPVVRDGFGREIPFEFSKVNEKVPSWDELIKVVTEGAKNVPYFSWIGWDVTVDEDGKPVVIEYNILNPGTVLYQFGGPLFDNRTDLALGFLKDEKARGVIPGFLKK